MTNNKTFITCGGILVAMISGALIGLKLLGYIDWAWGWVLSPVWLYLIIALTAYSIKNSNP